VATNIQKEAQELFGSPATASGLVTFDPQSYSRAVGLPGTEDIAGPNPLAAIATAGTRTYSPPTRSISTGFEQDINFGQSAFVSDINIAAPDVDDLETINDVPGFENVNTEAIKSLGLIGMTPTSLTRTFNNLTNLNVENIANNGLNIATKNTALAGALGIADKALSGAFNRGLSLANPQQAAQLGILASNIANIDINKLSDIPGQIGDNIQGFIEGISAFVNSPLKTLEEFGKMAGEFAQRGAFNTKLNSYTVNGIEQTYVTNQEGKIVSTPGFVKGIMGMAQIGTLAQAANMFVSLFSDETIGEKSARQMANLEVAAQLPGIKSTIDVPALATSITMGVTSVPGALANIGVAGVGYDPGANADQNSATNANSFDIVSINAADFPGLNTNINIDMAEYGRTGRLSGAVIGNVVDFIGLEDMQLEEQIMSAIDAFAASETYATGQALHAAIGELGISSISRDTQAVYAASVAADEQAPLDDLMEDPSSLSSVQRGIEDISEAILSGQIANMQDFMSYMQDEKGLTASNISALQGLRSTFDVTLDDKVTFSLEEQAPYTEKGQTVTVNPAYEAMQQAAMQYAAAKKGMAVSLQPPIGPQDKVIDPYAIKTLHTQQGENLGRDYNGQNPSFAAVGLAQAVMGLLGTNTFQPNFNSVHAEVAAEVLGVMSTHNATPEKAAEVLGVMSMHNATPEKAVDIMNQVEKMAAMPPSEITSISTEDVASTADAVQSFQNMSIEDMVNMSTASEAGGDAADMDADMGFGEDSDW
tara:strand:+ start:1209 stop:3503 length:2295 start_codon:yes stop_codon:yes gene_type:complete